MTKILNNLEIVGTSSDSNSRAVGITGGFVTIHNSLKLGASTNPNSILDILGSGTNSLTTSLKITNQSGNFLSFGDDTSLVLSGIGLSFGSTSSIRQQNLADLVVGNTHSGSISLNSYGIEGLETPTRAGLEFYLRSSSGLSSTYSRNFRFNTPDGGFFSLSKSDLNTSLLVFPDNTDSTIRLNSSSTRYFRVTTSDILASQIIRFGIESNATYSLAFFNNLSKLNINNISIQTLDTFSASYPVFLISNTQSNINIGLPSTNNPSIFIIPGQNISLTSSYIAATSSNLKNIFIGTLMNSVPTGTTFSIVGGNQNIFIGSKSELTIGSDNISIGEKSLENLRNGQRNVSIGVGALQNSTQSNSNVSIGYESGNLNLGNNNIFIGDGSGRYISTQSNVLFISNGSNQPFLDILQSTNNATAGVVPSWSFGNDFGNIASIGSEGQYYPSNNSGTGSYKTMFIGKGIWHYSSQLQTYAISTTLPSERYFTSSAGISNINIDAPGSNLELIAGIGRGTGTAGDIYFSTGKTISSTSSLHDKVLRMTIKGNSGRVGIGEGTFSLDPQATLHITTIGSSQSFGLRLNDGSEGLNKVLISDAYGNATWATASGSDNAVLGSGTFGFVPVFTGLENSRTLTNSNIYQTLGASNSILIGYGTFSPLFASESSTLRVLGDVYFDNSTLTSRKFYLNDTYLFDDVNMNLALGYQSLGGNTGSSIAFRGQYNIGLGYQSLRQVVQDSNFNIGLGFQSLNKLQTGTQNIAIGYLSMRETLTASNNIAIGANSLGSSASMNDNISIGFESLIVNRSSRNIAIGHNAGRELIHSGIASNVFIGYNSAAGFITGSNNTFITSNGNNNLGITQGSNNIILGQSITVATTSEFGNIIIGNSMSVRDGLTNSIILADGSGNQRVIVDERGFVGIGPNFTSTNPNALLHLWTTTSSLPAFRLVDGSEGINKILTSDASGFGSWVTPSAAGGVSFGLTLSRDNQFATPTFSVLLKGTFSGLTFSGITNSTFGGLAIDPTIAGNGLTFANGQLNWVAGLTVVTASTSFTFSNVQNNHLYDIITENRLVVVSPPAFNTLTRGFTFYLRKADLSNGVVVANNIFEHATSTTLSYLTRLNQTICYSFNGTIFVPYILDEGFIPPSTVMGNIGSTHSSPEEVPVIDIHDTVQQALTYNQGGWSDDWLSGVVYSSYGTHSINATTVAQSVFVTASNTFIGSTSSPLRIQSYSLAKGKTLRLSVSGTVSTSSSLTFNALIGSATVSSTTLTVNSGFIVDYSFKTLNIGVSGSVHGFGTIYYNGSSVGMMMSNQSSLNTTINNNLNFTISSTTTPVVTIYQSMIERLG